MITGEGSDEIFRISNPELCRTREIRNGRVSQTTTQSREVWVTHRGRVHVQSDHLDEY